MVSRRELLILSCLLFINDVHKTYTPYCLPLTVDPRSPNSRVTGIIVNGEDERDDVGGGGVNSGCFNFILSPTRKHDVDEKRQDTTFTKRETAEFTFMAEREAIINGDITDNNIPSSLIPSDVRLMNNNTNNDPLNTSKHSETTNTEVNLQGMGDTYLLQLVQQTAWNLNVNDAVTPRAGAGSRMQKNEPKKHVAEIPTDVIVPSSMDSSVKADDVVEGVARDVKNEEEEEVEFPEEVADGGGEDLWTLLPNEISDENTNNEDNIMGFSADSQEERQLDKVQGNGLDGEDQVLMMRTPKAGGSDSGFFADQQRHGGEDPILAAQLAVTHAMSPNSQNSNGNYNDKYWLDTKDDSQEDEDEEEEPGKIVMKAILKAPSVESDDNPNETYIQQQNHQQVNVNDHLPMQEEEMQVPNDNNEDEFNSHYYMPPSSQGSPSDINQDQDTQKNQQRRHQYANDEEANKHFDSIMSSFELSLNRNDHRPSLPSSPKSNRPPSRTRTHNMSPLTAAAHKKKRAQQQGRSRHHQTHEDDLESKQGSIYSSSNSSTFLEETIMGRKLTHTPSTSHQTHSTDLVHRAEEMVNQANETLDLLNNQEEDEEYSVDNIQAEFEQEKEEEQPSVGKRRQRGIKHLSRLHYSTQRNGDDADKVSNFDLGSGDEEEVDQVSFDSSVNWDVLNYSMSDNNSTNFGLSDRMGSPRSNASGRRRNINDGDDVKWSEPKLVNDDNRRPTEGIVEAKQHLDIHMYTPASSQRSTILCKKTGSIVPPSPEQHTTSSIDLTPRALERIEQIKRHHDEEIGKLRDDNVASPSEEENVEPTSTNQMKQRVESIKKYHDNNGMTTPRTQNKMEMEVQSRIDAMKMLHQDNMDKMRNAMNTAHNGRCADDGSNVTGNDSMQKSRDDDHIAQCVGLWKANQSRFEKAKQRYSSLHKKTSTTPKHHQQSLFKFDDDVVNSDKDRPRVALPASPLSPRVQELMMENDKLDEEMRQIRLLSPRNSNAISQISLNQSEKSLSVTISTEEHVPAAQYQFTPSSARYTTPRGNDVHTSSVVSNVKPETETEMMMSDSISELIADVKKFLDENQNDEVSLALKV